MWKLLFGLTISLSRSFSLLYISADPVVSGGARQRSEWGMSVVGLATSSASNLLGFGCFGCMPNGASHVCSWIGHLMVLHGFWTVSKLPVRWCQAVALAFLHLSLGRQKATSGSFLTDGFGWWGLNPAEVSLFRMHVERRPSGPLSCIQPISTLPVRWCHFNNFDAACQVMSGNCVGLSSSIGHQKAMSGSFSTDGFGWLGLNPAGVSYCFACLVHSMFSGPL